MTHSKESTDIIRKKKHIGRYSHMSACYSVYCVAVSCSVLQYVAVCRSMLQCTAGCCSVLQWKSACDSIYCVALCLCIRVATNTHTHTHSLFKSAWYSIYCVALHVISLLNLVCKLTVKLTSENVYSYVFTSLLKFLCTPTNFVGIVLYSAPEASWRRDFDPYYTL